MKDKHFPGQTREVTLVLPADAECATIGGKWERLPDGRIQARYTASELCLAMALSDACRRCVEECEVHELDGIKGRWKP